MKYEPVKVKSIYRLIKLISLVVITLTLSGCDEYSDMAEDTETPRITVEQSRLSYEHEVEGIVIQTEYHLGDYDITKWKITDSKSINLVAKIKSNPDDTEVLVDHVHADVTIKATDPQLNGLTQDSMDNSYHGTSQDGFHISTKYSYENVFAIEGFSKDIIEGWGFYAGNHGSSRITQTRLTEKNLISSGAYASNLDTVWNFLVKHPSDTKYHLVSVKDSVIIPLYTKNIVKSDVEVTKDGPKITFGW